MSRSGSQVSAPWADAYPGRVADMLGWLRRHPWQADGLLALLLVALSSQQWHGSSPAAVAAVSVLLAATVVPRRRYPVTMFAVAVTIGAAQVAFSVQPAGEPLPSVAGLQLGAAIQPTVADAAILVLLYTLAAHRPRRVSITGLVICLLGSAVAIVRWAPAHTAHSGGAVLAAAAGLGGAALTAWVLGDSVAYRYRRAYYASLEERAARLEAERDAQARIAQAAERARELQERRARVVDESAARLRRIERDLHDGAQVRLAALAMTLGEIKESLDAAAGVTGNGASVTGNRAGVADDGVGDGADDSARVGDGAGDGARTRMLVAAAHQNAKETLAELRDLARGIHPPVLDRGLGAALGSLAGTSTVPVALEVSIAERPSPAIEAMAYFCAAELLANVAKHSGASHATVSVSEYNERIRMTVTDDGSGGARLAPGGGLAGLLERVQTVDGRFGIDSPAGGPTVITIELPGHA
jgi:signal transduction histidine kinase